MTDAKLIDLMENTMSGLTVTRGDGAQLYLSRKNISHVLGNDKTAFSRLSVKEQCRQFFCCSQADEALRGLDELFSEQPRGPVATLCRLASMASDGRRHLFSVDVNGNGGDGHVGTMSL
ncbi:hypothetical protein [Pseudomonas entomophila]|uniref:hypothetical protein n=1 Tax=Pseudomonas entomophila TaxID=312306 RepID=UPI001F023F31|nr:hypothetical protein [Pseudomonas entomophila]MCG8291424.1 hypothetical protein [Pseudomonas entomophila]